MPQYEDDPNNSTTPLPWYEDLPDNSPVKASMRGIKELISKSQQKVSHGTQVVDDILSQYRSDLKTAVQPGMIDDLLGFFKENLKAVPEKFVERTGEMEQVFKDIQAGKDPDISALTQSALELTMPMAAMAKAAKTATGQAAKAAAEAQKARLLGEGPAKAVKAEVQAEAPYLMRGDKAALEFVKQREMPAIERLAYSVKGGPIPEMVIKDKQAAYQLWQKAAREADVPLAVNPPAYPNFTTDGKTIFQPRDQGLLDMIGTPANTAVRRGNMEAYKGYSEMNLQEALMKRRIATRTHNDDLAITAVGGKGAANVVAAQMRKDTFEEAIKKMSEGEREFATYIRKQKYDPDRKLLQAKFREDVRPDIEKRIRAQYENDLTMTPTDIEGKINAAVSRRVLDSWGIEDYLPQIMPGDFLIRNKKTGAVIGSARNRAKAETILFDEAENLRAAGQKVSADDFTVDSKTFFDADLVKHNRGATGAFIRDLTEQAAMTNERIGKAINGEFGFLGTAREKAFGNLFKRRNSPGFEKDIKNVFDIYNRGIERYVALNDTAKRVEPVIKELEARGYQVFARDMKENLDNLWGVRGDKAIRLDNEIQRVPFLRDHVSPQILERWGGKLQELQVAMMLKYAARFHAANASQLIQTLAPIASADDVIRGAKLFHSKAGKEILESYGVGGYSRTGSSLGPVESFNQEVAFMTMYDKAMRLGLDSRQAADFGFIRGNLYSQFHGLKTDRPGLFRKIDPTGAITIFQRFGVKQMEQLLDIIADRSVSGAGKWIAGIGLMGGLRALTLGGGGWLGYEAYQLVKATFGETAADVLHVGLPALAGVDLSNTLMPIQLPNGASATEKIGTFMTGPLVGISSSIVGAALNTKALEPSAGRRAMNAFVARIPLVKQLDSVRRIIMDDYDIKTPDGKLRYTADLKDIGKMIGGFRPIKETRLTQWSEAVIAARLQQDKVLDFAAARYGTAMMSGLGIPDELRKSIQKDIDRWNVLWPDLAITPTDIITRAKARAKNAQMTYQERLTRQMGKVGKAFEKDLQRPSPGGGGESGGSSGVPEISGDY